MTDSYLAADERARDARRAGLQAKKDEQPKNTARSYAAKQLEWKARHVFTYLSLLLRALTIVNRRCRTGATGPA